VYKRQVPYVNISHFTIEVNGARGINIVSDYNQIVDCNVLSGYEMQYCMWINYADYNKVIECNFAGGYVGIQIHGTSGGDYNQITGCSFSDNRVAGIKLDTACCYNEITDCMFSNNTGHGLYIYQHSNYNQITGCTLTGNQGIGLCIERSSYNIFRENNIFGNAYNFGVHSLIDIPEFYQDIDTSNLVEGKPMYYLVEEDGYSLDGSITDVGYVALISCKNIALENIDVEGNEIGILVVNTSISSITGCGFSANQKMGMKLFQSSDIQITDCVVSNNLEEGIYAYQLDATPTNYIITGCTCLYNGKDGVYLKDCSGDQVINCSCSDNKKMGIHLGNATCVTGCTCVDNKGNGISVGDYYHHVDSCQITNCICTGNDGTGISLSYTTGGSIVSDCNCLNNNGNGITIGSSSNIQVANCSCIDNQGKGADLYGSSSLEILNCDFSCNRGDGIRYGSSQMTGCTITGNQGNGVVGGSGQMTGCTITGNHGHGISGTNFAVDCTISGNQGDGVSMGYGSGGLTNCIISDNQGNGISTGGTSNSHMIGCTISSNQGIGIYMYNSKNNQVTACTISGNNGGGVYVYWQSDENTLTACTISGNQEIGLHIESSSNNQITDCIISNNYHGLYLNKSPNNIFRSCSLWYNDYSFTIDGEDTLHFIQDIDPSNRIDGKAIYYLLEQEDSVIDGNILDIGYVALVRCERVELKNINISTSTQGILVIETSDSIITNCTCSNNLLHGLYLIGSNSNTITGCTCLGNERKGIYIHDSDYVQVTNCTSSGNQEYGIYVYDSDHVQVTNCTSSENQFGLAIDASAYSKLRDNTMFNNTYNFGMTPEAILEGSAPGPDLYQDMLDPGQPATNTVNGKGVYYYMPLMGTVAPPVIDGQAMNIGYLAVLMAGYDPIPPTTIKNVDLSHNIQGLTMLACFGCTIENVTSSHSYGYGMGFIACQWNTIRNCNCSDNRGPPGGLFPPDGMWFMLDIVPGIPGNMITDCTCSNNAGNGISLNAFWGAGCNGYTVTGCTCYGNGNSGIAITADSHNNLIASCTCFDNNGSGITIAWKSYDTTVQHCTCFNNQGSGIDIQWNSQTDIDYCTCTYNKHGISAKGRGTTIDNCTCAHNEVGIQLNPSTSGGVSIASCNCSDNIGDGIYGFHVGDNAITDCTISNNLRDGIHMDGEIGLGWMTNNILSNNNNTGIYIDSGTYEITGCTITNGHIGIYIGRSNNNVLRGNSIQGADGYGMVVEGSTIDYLHQDINDSNTINGKKIYYLDGESDKVLEDDFSYLSLVSCDNITVQYAATTHGILLADTTNSTVSGVSSQDSANGIGIYLWEGSNNSIIDCNSSGNSEYGLCIRDSPDNFLRGNTIYDNIAGFAVEGVVLADFYQDIDISNTVDGKPIYYLCKESDKIIDGSTFGGSKVGYLALISCSNITAQNLDAPGVLLADTNDSTIFNVDSYGGGIGIYLWMSPNNNIVNCKVYDNAESGILLRNSLYNTIANCKSYNNLGDGIKFVDGSSYNEIVNCSVYCNSGLFGGINIEYSPDNEVTGCISHDNTGLIAIRVNYAQHVDIVDCTVYNSSYYGIYYYTRTYGSDNSNIVNCTVYNTQYGIYLAFTDDSTIENCVLYNNSRGIHLYASSNGNMVHHNNLMNNDINGWDECTNQWDDGSEGNYWSDYTGVDKDGDGIGDTPYEVPGGGGNKDRYPLIPPNIPPYLPSEPDPEDGATGVSIDADIRWTGGDPDEGDTVTYDVYFGTTSPPSKVVSNQSGTTYDTGTMSYSQKYYWQIVVWDNHGASTGGPIWNFTTVEQPNYPPYTPSNPDPANHAIDVDVNANLSWTGGDPNTGDILAYDVYFGTNSTPPRVVSNQSGTTYNPGTLVYERQYYWKIISWDNHGASTEGPLWDFTTVLDTQPPVTTHTFEGTMGGNGWYVSDVTITLNATDDLSGVNATRYRINNGVWTIYADPFAVTVDGEYAIDYYSVDNEGNVEFPNSASFKIDQTPPVTTHIFDPPLPNGENGWYISNVTVTLLPSDEMSGIDSLWYRIDGGSWKLYTAPFIVSDDGNHTLYYYSYDRAGNFEGIKSVNVKIDKTTPTTTYDFDGDMGENGWYISDVEVTLSAVDETSDVNATWYTLGDTWIEYTKPFNVTEDDEHTLKYYSVDNAGNIESEETTVFKIDQTPPAITLERQKRIGEIIFTAIVNDTTSGIDKVEFYIDNLLQFTDTEEPYQWTWTGFGEHTVKAIVYDNAGNSNETSMSTPQSSSYSKSQSSNPIQMILTMLKQTKLYGV